LKLNTFYQIPAGHLNPKAATDINKATSAF